MSKLSQYMSIMAKEAYELRKQGKRWKEIAHYQSCTVQTARCHYRQWERHIGLEWSNKTK